ncbi:MAG: DNA primase [Alphaproteobacteria bacterium]|nr:DNA primase [Alphaproteobacteria bacterium]
MTLSPAFLDELRARVPISPVVARRVKLVRAGREMKGCCPFHNEKSPSFYVNDDKGFYHCFGCSAHGDVIRFLTDAMGLPFMEAVKQLAAEAGMEVPAPSPEARARAEVADSLVELTARAAAWFQAQLAGDQGAAARAYLDRRGLRPETVKAFSLGFSLDSRTALRSHLKDATAQTLLDAGLIGKTDAGETFDRFRGRLMFPIRDARGRVVGFGGRALGDVQPKYLNSADGPLFDKGRLLYNLDQAGPVARKTGRLIVVEGYMDVIGLAQAGLAEAVAPLGTAMTEQQLALAWRLVDVPTLCFDGDAAGNRAASRAALRALPLLKPGKSLAIATLPQGQDPDDICRSGGGPAFEAVLAQAVPLIDHVWTMETTGLEQATPERRAQARARLREAAASIADPDVRSLYQAEFSQRFETAFMARPQRPAWQPRKPGEKWQAPIPGASPALKALASRRDDPLVTALIAGLLLRPALADAHGDALAALRLDGGEDAAVLAAVLAATARDPALEKAALHAQLAGQGLGPAVDRLLAGTGLAFSFARGDGDAGMAASDFAVAVQQVTARLGLVRALEAATARFQASLDEADYEAQQGLRRDVEALDAAMMRLAESRREG